MKTKKILLSTILVAIIISAFLLIRPATAESDYQTLTAKQAHRMIKNDPNVIIIDVRNQSEYDLGHLYNAILIPVFAIENKTAPINLPEPPLNDSIAMDIYERLITALNSANISMTR